MNRVAIPTSYVLRKLTSKKNLDAQLILKLIFFSSKIVNIKFLLIWAARLHIKWCPTKSNCPIYFSCLVVLTQFQFVTQIIVSVNPIDDFVSNLNVHRPRYLLLFLFLTDSSSGQFFEILLLIVTCYGYGVMKFPFIFIPILLQSNFLNMLSRLM